MTCSRMALAAVVTASVSLLAGATSRHGRHCRDCAARGHRLGARRAAGPHTAGGSLRDPALRPRPRDGARRLQPLHGAPRPKAGPCR